MGDIVIQALDSAPITRVEKRAVAASAAKRIDAYGSGDLVAELGNVVKWVALDVGVKMNEAEATYTVVRMAELLNRHYGYLTIREVRYAFELMLTGDLDDYLPKREGQPDRSAYGAFNMTYVCKVLNAYRAMRNAALKKYRDNIPKPERTPSAEDEFKAAQEIRAKLNSCYAKYCAGEPFEATLIEERLYYDFLAGKGYAEKIEQPVARDITGSMTPKGKDAPYARERRAVILQCFEGLKKANIKEL